MIESIVLVYFFYGLAFFSMGLAILLEIGHGSDVSLRHALRPLAAFGFLHGVHEWLEVFERLGVMPGMPGATLAWEGLRLALLAFSFLSLGAFGASMLTDDERSRRLSLLLPAGLAAVWGGGVFVMRGQFTQPDLLIVADVWTRYVLAIPASLVASLGLIAQQRRFRRAGMAQFGRDSLWAAVAFFWYGIVGQTFVRASQLQPSMYINQGMFQDLFGFPVQLLRAGAAIVASVFVMRFLRSFEVETKDKIHALQEARLKESEQREALRGEFLRRIVEAQEAERVRVARELHDETGQSLTAIGLALRGVSVALRQDGVKAEKNLRQLEQLTAHSLEELQRLIADLRPSHLDDLGLPAALRWYASEVQRRSQLEVRVEVEGSVRDLHPAVKTALFRVAQEALTNTVKHANADHASIRLIFGSQMVTVLAEDDGVGFNTSQKDKQREHWGVLGMKERTSLLGGDFQIQSQVGRGTLVSVTIPYEQAGVEEDHEHSSLVGG